MSKKRKQHIFTALLLTAALTASAPVYAYSTQEQIDIAQQENAETQNALAGTEEVKEAYTRVLENQLALWAETTSMGWKE